MGKQRSKLYTAYSVVNGFRERDNVTFVWYARKRKKGARDYAALIANYGSLAPAQRTGLEAFVDALFQEPEIQALRGYLHHFHDVEIFVKPVPLPLTRKGAAQRPAPEIPEIPGTGIYMLAREPEYDLPMEVWASYDLRSCPLTAEAQLRQRKRLPGVRFLQEALELLGMGADADLFRIDGAVAELYDRRGFSVQQKEAEAGAPASRTSNVPSG